MACKKNKPGDVVMMYEIPGTRVNPQGKATLLRFHEDYSDYGVGLSLWEVSFIDDPYAERFFRIVGPQEPT